ncbi:transposon-encoded TnpW family protein [Eubacteriales bacterium OttesenSCG-928-M02]|nr:transposon-encoded TnpW family protein [Eubacteriales bacterium OttesenSCG-928-M02]
MNCINPSHPIPSEATPPIESSVFTKRIGSTNYRVSVHFSKTSRETMNDKILRLMKNEAARP